METEQNTILTVTQISLSLKSCVEQVFSNIRVKGEVVGVKKAASGHIYFSLKDADSVLSAVQGSSASDAGRNPLPAGASRLTWCRRCGRRHRPDPGRCRHGR